MRKITMILITVFCLSSVVFSQAKKDTTQTKPITYVLLGQLSDFQLLFKAVNTPGDMKRDEITALLAWIQLIKPLPPAEEKKEEKPKN